MNSKLPERACFRNPDDGKICSIVRGEHGYHELNDKGKEIEDKLRGQGMTTHQIVDTLNSYLGCTRQQQSAMVFGSMFSWDLPGADPDMYDQNGIPHGFTPFDRKASEAVLDKLQGL